MYIPTWLIIIAAIIVFYIYKSRKSGNNISVENIEASVSSQKKELFSLVHFDSPHFIDVQDAFDAMEINYLRLKQRLSHTPEKQLEIAKDWYRYVEALGNLKHARIMLDVDWDDGAWDRADENMKEPSIVKDEVEKKFKSLLDKDWQNIPLDYFKRMETMKKPDKKTEDHYEIGGSWKYYYQNSANLIRIEEKRMKEKEDKKS